MPSLFQADGLVTSPISFDTCSKYDGIAYKQPSWWNTYSYCKVDFAMENYGLILKSGHFWVGVLNLLAISIPTY